MKREKLLMYSVFYKHRLIGLFDDYEKALNFYNSLDYPADDVVIKSFHWGDSRGVMIDIQEV